MRLVRIKTAAGPRYGWVHGAKVRTVVGSFEAGFKPTGESVPFDASALLAPVEPSKVIGIGTNYVAHAVEMGKPVPDEPKIFLKAPTSIIGPGEPIRVPPVTNRVDHEAELGVVIGKRISWADRDAAAAAIFGYTVVNDVTARDFQQKDGVFARAKGFDSFCPVGPWIETELDPRDLRVWAKLDDQIRQDGRTSDMVFDVIALVAFVSKCMTLLPGDLIATGTPPGVSPMVAGQRITVAVDGIGELTNPVENRADRG